MLAAAIAATLGAGASIAEAQARTLHWKSMSVEARLEDSGALHVTERHHMVFDGAWNGGERPFRAGAARPEILSVTRVDPRTKSSHPMKPARAAAMEVDEYAWAGTNLRWRSRRATDPPFRNHEAIYVIEYRAYDLVIADGGRFRIAHDFAFTGRPGRIERFTLDLDFAPSWKAAPGVALPLERSSLGPDQTVTLRMALEWTGPGRPKHVASAVAARPAPSPYPVAAPPPPPPPAAPLADRLAAFALFVVLAGAATYWFLSREEQSGAYGPSPKITPAWLDANIFRHRPEVIGAAWDGETGHAEAAALIAVLVAEKKIANIPPARPTRRLFGASDSVARLKLLVPRDSLVEYERAFVDRLFVDGDEIDLDRLRKHYAASGFNPADAIRTPLEREAGLLVGEGRSGQVGLGCFAAIFIVCLAMPAAGIFLLGDDWLLVSIAGAISFTAAMSLGAVYRTRLKRRALALAMVLPLLASAAMATASASNVTGLEVVLVLTLVLVVVAFQTVRSTRTPREEENLRALRAARRFFQDRLRKGSAGVDEHWIPYLLAFGLGDALDRWAVAAPREREPDRDRYHSDATSFRSGDSGNDRSSAGPTFVPGGGAFGGAGASGSWAASIGSFAAVVPAPAPASDSSSWSSSSSSDWSSSSSDSSSGSDSGGGSGGGW